jgi:hypothetical protein
VPNGWLIAALKLFGSPLARDCFHLFQYLLKSFLRSCVLHSIFILELVNNAFHFQKGSIEGHEWITTAEVSQSLELESNPVV